MKFELLVTEKQLRFIEAGETEVLFGGAAGGGKSMGQLIDAAVYAIRHAGSRQLLLRRSYPELEKTLIRQALLVFPREIYNYNASRHEGRFSNGSELDFGYCDNDKDVFRYQSAEYDVIRFDELTHFSEFIYLYLCSRLRGANSFPKQLKSSTNPGGVGHVWVKKRFIDAAPPLTSHKTELGRRIFIPSLVEDNRFLMDSDPEYAKRLESLPENERRALLLGEWNLSAGRFFEEWGARHVCTPFDIDFEHTLYFAMDYGLDMLAGYFIAVDRCGRCYVIDEIYESGLTISAAAAKILERGRRPYAYIAPRDLFSRRQDTGRTAAEIFADKGIYLERVSTDRKNGWLALKELLRLVPDEGGGESPRLVVFDSCVNLIRTLPALQRDIKNPNDAAIVPHELTHAPDALRYFAAYRFLGASSDSVEDSSLARLMDFGLK